MEMIHLKHPEVIYFKDESNIANLIEMRLNDNNALNTKTYILEYFSSRKMQEKLLPTLSLH